VWQVNLDNNSVTLVQDYGDYSGRTSVTCANKVVSVYAVTGAIGEGLMTIVQ